MPELEKPLLDAWRQGDFALGEFELPFIGSDEEGVFVSSILPPGVAIVSQSCDIIRDHVKRPYVQVAALIAANDAELKSIQAGEKPQFGIIPGLLPHKLVVDLDVTATIAKAAVVSWKREIGCETDADRRQFAEALARHKQRFAFPDKFNDAVRPLRRWIERRAKKANAAGDMLRAIAQIRVRCTDWNDPIDLAFMVILCRDMSPQETIAWAGELKRLEDMSREFYPKAIFYFITWEEMSALEYLSTDRLDLDGLSDA